MRFHSFENPPHYPELSSDYSVLERQFTRINEGGPRLVPRVACFEDLVKQYNAAVVTSSDGSDALCSHPQLILGVTAQGDVLYVAKETPLLGISHAHDVETTFPGLLEEVCQRTLIRREE